MPYRTGRALKELSASYEKTNLTLMRDQDIRKCLGTTTAGYNLCSLLSFSH